MSTSMIFIHDRNFEIGPLKTIRAIVLLSGLRKTNFATVGGWRCRRDTFY